MTSATYSTAHFNPEIEELPAQQMLATMSSRPALAAINGLLSSFPVIKVFTSNAIPIMVYKKPEGRLKIGVILIYIYIICYRFNYIFSYLVIIMRNKFLHLHTVSQFVRYLSTPYHISSPELWGFSRNSRIMSKNFSSSSKSEIS